MKTILLIFGTRPEAIKMCPLVLELRKRTEWKTLVCVTSQHREMLYQVLDKFHIVPEYDLDIMKEQQSLFEITMSVLDKMKNLLVEANPDIVLVHGDTTTAFAAALAGFYTRIPIGHVEAGLRTYDMGSPYPEEFNRCAIDHMARCYFAPTETAKNNLLKEGKPKAHIFVTGNTGIDALRYTVKDDFYSDHLTWADGSKLVLITAHRRENIGEPMRAMFRAIRRVLEEHSDVKAIYPVHPNPQVLSIAKEILGDCDRIRLAEPLDAGTFHNILARTYLVLTDSGGIQEEAPYFGIPVLVMRTATERTEGVEAKTLKLIGVNEDAVYCAFTELLENKAEYAKMSKAVNPYGDGFASKRIADILGEML